MKKTIELRKMWILLGLFLIIFSIPLATGMQKDDLTKKLTDRCYHTTEGCAKNIEDLVAYEYEYDTYFNGITNIVVVFNSLGLAILILSIKLPTGKIKK